MKNQDIIFIKKLKIETYIGIYDWEQTQKQPIILNIKVGINNKVAMTNDINETVNYKDVYETIIAFVETGKFRLIENLAEQIASLILEKFSTNYIKVQIAKPKALKNAIAGITIKRIKRTKDM